MKKYLCIGGYVYSRTDNDRHFIPTQRLAQLYQVNPEECYFAKDRDDILLNALRTEELIILEPRYDGNYLLEKKPNNTKP